MPATARNLVLGATALAIAYGCACAWYLQRCSWLRVGEMGNRDVRIFDDRGARVVPYHLSAPVRLVMERMNDEIHVRRTRWLRH